MRDFRNLNVWQKAHELALAVYKVSRSFPPDGLYGLSSQMRRSAVSVAANIAEGCGREGDAELVRFLRMAMGSASELEYHVLLAQELGLLQTAQSKRLADGVTEVKRMLTGLVQKLKADR